MSIRDLFINYKQILSLGLTKAEAKEVDMLDGKQDNKYEGRSLFDVVNELKTAYDDENSDSIIKLLHGDTFYDYVKYKLADISTVFNLEEVNVWGVLSENPEKLSDELIDKIYGNNETLGESIEKIDENNVVDVLSKYKEKSDEKNRFLGLKYDDETLIEAILDERIPKEEKKKYLIHIKEAIVKKIESYTGDADYVSQIFDKVLDKTLTKAYPFQSSKQLDELVTKMLDIIVQLEEINAANNKQGTTGNFRELVKEIISDYDYKLSKNMDDYYGNGKFDKPSLQLAGNCRFHAGINSMLATPKGKQYINNLIVKDKYNGNISVYLPGAKDKGLPIPNGDGIYTYTEYEIETEGMPNCSLGDGDYTAFMMAVNDYEKATNSKFDGKGGYESDFYNLIFGEDYAKESSNSFIENKRIDNLIIGTSKHNQKRFIKHNLFTEAEINYRTAENEQEKYEIIKQMFYSGDYSINLGLNISGLKTINGEELMDMHAYSIKEMKDNSIILEESNNPGVPLEISVDTFLKFDRIESYKIPDNVL